MRPTDEPSVILAGSKLVARLDQLNRTLSAHVDPRAGSESVFIGQIHSGEIFNQYPQACWLEGTRRWLPGMNRAEVEKSLSELFAEEARESGLEIQADIRFIRDAFLLDPQDRIVRAFQQAYRALRDEELPVAAKPFVDDGNSFWGLAQRPAITHGPHAGGQHTVNEWVSIDDLVRVAAQYVLTAITYCPSHG
jgi:acetylornithine deacetylase/succinyl-diaminopimelate desuccinylase-like protein